jgi:hypothetical protein
MKKGMNEQVFERMLCEGRITAAEVLRKTAVNRVDGVMGILLPGGFRAGLGVRVVRAAPERLVLLLAACVSNG